jgi:hypothetical protein
LLFAKKEKKKKRVGACKLGNVCCWHLSNSNFNEVEVEAKVEKKEKFLKSTVLT